MVNSTLAIYAKEKSPRLHYVLQWIFSETWGIAWHWAPDPGSADLVYGLKEEGKICIPSSGLLFEKGSKPKPIAWGEWQGLPVFFWIEESGYSLPFDLFGAAFFYLSRYEEYGKWGTDAHGRFPHEESMIYQAGHLPRPLIDEWLDLWRKQLVERGIRLTSPSFRFLPTYDIDMVFSYRHRGVLRNIVQFLLASFQDRPKAQSMIRTWLKGEKDPYDCFEFMDQLQSETGVKGLYFFLVAQRLSDYDRNLSPKTAAMKSILWKQSQINEIGLHPSYYSLDQKDMLRAEKQLLESLIQKSISRSRQHYIRWRHPSSLRRLLELGIREEYSMGYAKHIGFRAGTSRDFPWYDLESESATSLRIFPFCFMDTTARYYHGWNGPQSFEMLNNIGNKLLSLGGQFIPIFHNSSLGGEKGWEGWGESFADFHRHWSSFSNVDPSADADKRE